MKFEYATVPLLSHATKQILDTWGSDGWELVQVVPAPGGEQLVAYARLFPPGIKFAEASFGRVLTRQSLPVGVRSQTRKPQRWRPPQRPVARAPR